MERIIQAKVLRIEKPQDKTPEEHGETTVVLQCPLGEIIDKTAKVTVRKAIFNGTGYDDSHKRVHRSSWNRQNNRQRRGYSRSPIISNRPE
jgi:hypothetical protein